MTDAKQTQTTHGSPELDADAAKLEAMGADPGPSFHIDAAQKRDGLPGMGAAKPCGKAGCPAPDFETGFGLAGGGYGVYEYCDVCGEIVSKTEINDE